MAINTNYVPRLTSDGMRGNRYWYSSLNTFYPANGLPNCTCYAYGRWLEIANGDKTKLAGLFTRSFGGRNGGNWYRSSPSLQAGKSNPQPGDIACWGWSDFRKNGWGHVAVIEQVFSDHAVCSASYWGGAYFNHENLPKSNGYRSYWMESREYILHGFLRMGGASGGVVPSIDMPTKWVDTIDYFIADGSDEEINNMVMAYVALSRADPNMTLEAICGILGNMWRESHLNPGMREIRNHNNGGLVGWTPLTKWSHEASIRHIPWNDGDGQCEWVVSGKYWHWNGEAWVLFNNHWVPNRMSNPMTYGEYKACTDSPEDCATHFMQGYEGPGVPAEAERREKARYYYEYLLANIPLLTTNMLPPPTPFNPLDVVRPRLKIYFR